MADGFPWWIKWGFIGGSGLMSATIGIFKPEYLAIGFIVGAFLVVLAILGAGFHLIRTRRKTKMGPIYLIGLGALLILGGVGWEIFNSLQLPNPTAAPDQSNVQLDNRPAFNPGADLGDPSILSPPILAKRYLSTGDKERISDALIAISRVNSKTVNPLFQDAEKLWVPWHNMDPKVDINFAKASLKESQRIRVQIEVAQKGFYDEIVKEYEDYWPDLKDVLLHGKTDGVHPLNKLKEVLTAFDVVLQSYIEISENKDLSRSERQALPKLVWATSEDLLWANAEVVGWSEFMKTRIQNKKDSLSQ